MFLIDVATPGHAMRLVFGVTPNDSTHLLPAHFERPIECFLVEELLADFFFYSVVAETVEHIGRQSYMFTTPVRHQLSLAFEIRATQIAADLFAQAWLPGPFMPLTDHRIAWHEWDFLSSCKPMPRPSEFRFPFCHGGWREFPAKQGW